MWVNDTGLIVMYELYTFSVKTGAESKVESYVEVNAWTDWWQQDLIPEYDQILAYWTHKYYTGHIIANNKVRTISSEDQCLFTT